jgi:hypothetical protein
VIQDSFRDVLIDAELRETGAAGAAQVVIKHLADSC